MEPAESLVYVPAGLTAMSAAEHVPVRVVWLAAVVVGLEPVDPYRLELQYARRTAPRSSLVFLLLYFLVSSNPFYH